MLVAGGGVLVTGGGVLVAGGGVSETDGGAFNVDLECRCKMRATAATDENLILLTVARWAVLGAGTTARKVAYSGTALGVSLRFRTGVRLLPWRDTLARADRSIARGASSWCSRRSSTITTTRGTERT